MYIRTIADSRELFDTMLSQWCTLGNCERSAASGGAAVARSEGDGVPSEARGSATDAPGRGRASASGRTGRTALPYHQSPSRDRLRRGVSHLYSTLHTVHV